jgi:alpha-D-xyloside xylohydrolase
MFGPDLLVAPVAAYGARERLVYRPASSQGTNAWTGMAFGGGMEVRVSAPRGLIPLFLRDGASLPVAG